MATAQPTSGELALQVMRQQATLFAEHVPRAHPGGNPEHVHDARVATRRLRAALRLFGDLLPHELDGLHDELGWFATQLGAVRDLDVHLQRLDSIGRTLCLVEALAAYSALVESQRSAAYEAFEAASRSSRFIALLECLRQLNTAISVDDPPIEQDAPRRLRGAYRELKESASGLDEQSPAVAFHKVRIRAKQLRYACEFFQPTYGKPARRLIRAATDLQELLGDHQDGVVAAQRIHAALAAEGAAWPVETAVALGQVIQWEAQHAADLRRHFKQTYREVRRDWRRLRRAF